MTIAERSGAPAEGLRGRKTGTDHTTVVHDHRHGNSGRAHGPTNKEDHVCARRRDVRREGFRPANPEGCSGRRESAGSAGLEFRLGLTPYATAVGRESCR